MNENRRTTYWFVFLLEISIVQSRQTPKNDQFSAYIKANHEVTNDLLSSESHRLQSENEIDAIKGTVHRQHDNAEDNTDSDECDQQRINAITWYKVLDLLRSYVVGKNDNGEASIPDTNISSSLYTTTANTTMTVMTAPLCSTTTANQSYNTDGVTNNPSCINTTTTPTHSTTITIPSCSTIITTQSCNTIINITATISPCVVTTTPESYRRRTRFGGLSRDLPSFSDGFQPNLVNLINSYQNLAVWLDSY